MWELDGPELKNMVDAEKTGAFRCGTFNASDQLWFLNSFIFLKKFETFLNNHKLQRQIACGDFIGKMSIIDLENHSKVNFDQKSFF